MVNLVKILGVTFLGAALLAGCAKKQEEMTVTQWVEEYNRKTDEYNNDYAYTGLTPRQQEAYDLGYKRAKEAMEARKYWEIAVFSGSALASVFLSNLTGIQIPNNLEIAHRKIRDIVKHAVYELDFPSVADNEYKETWEAKEKSKPLDLAAVQKVKKITGNIKWIESDPEIDKIIKDFLTQRIGEELPEVVEAINKGKIRFYYGDTTATSFWFRGTFESDITYINILAKAVYDCHDERNDTVSEAYVYTRSKTNKDDQFLYSIKDIPINKNGTVTFNTYFLGLSPVVDKVQYDTKETRKKFFPENVMTFTRADLCRSTK